MTTFAFLTGYTLDLLFGDPEGMPHPIRMMGYLIARGEKLLGGMRCRSEKAQYYAGVILTMSVVCMSFLTPLIILYFAGLVHPYLRFLFEAMMCYQILATKALRQESMKVYQSLQKGNLPEARMALSRIVGRDTENLSPAQVTKGALETVAENLSDGVIAPMFFIVVGGAPFGFLYKAVNTLDSMIGYKNERYLHFGRFAAKLDDWVNYIPARISAYLMLLAVWILRYDARKAFRIYQRDRHNHTSPNAAHTEAVCAGALGIQLAGNNFYFGKLVVKPTIGDETREVEVGDILKVNRILYMTSFLGLVTGVFIRGSFFGL
jgi:adenosylcobinamide-phosphate synthase